MVYIKSENEIRKIREASRVIGCLLETLKEKVVPGVSTMELDRFAEDFIRSEGGIPAFKGYRVAGLPPFPGSLCTSVNSVIVHGIPSVKVILKEGDILGIDVGVIKDGYCGDAAWTYAVGKVSAEAERLMAVTEKALELGISTALPGKRVGDISYAIGSYVKEQGYYVADDLTGHGVGRELHEEPMIPNWGKKDRGLRLRPGMTLAIEPMVNVGTNRIKEKGWEFFVADNSLSAHFEHTILVTNDQPQILSVK
ncbi:MAG TPA: type I methionyl aminopeptidase [Candidatus Cloacimonadota bacterium]|nr:type I methionyl aminopeptidase [Candidatus Cloacimonadota bacterium]